MNLLRRTWLGKDLRLIDDLGYPRAGRRLTLLAALSFVGGLSQAIILALIAAAAVNLVRSKGGVTEFGLHFGLLESILLSLVLACLFAVSNIAAAVVGSRLAARILQRVRSTVMASFLSSDWSTQSADFVGHVQQTLFYECEQVGSLIGSVSRMLALGASVVALLLVAFIVGPVFALGIVAAGLLLSMLLRPIQRRIRSSAVALVNQNAAISQRVNEFTRLAREFRVFGVEAIAAAQLEAGNATSAASFERSQLLFQVAPLSFQLAGVLFMIFGLALVHSIDGSDLASAAAVFVIIMRTIPLASNLQGFAAGAHAQSAVLGTVSEDVARFRASARRTPTGVEPATFDVVVDDVSFAYTGRGAVLDNVSFVLPDGQSLGILGRSGSGKTTLSQLVLGILEPSAGTVRIGGARPDEVVEGVGRTTVAMVSQDAGLIRGTIAENISFYRDLPTAVVVAAAHEARLDGDIERMTGGFDAEVSDAGSNLSGGQRQRLALARALAGRPRLLILDEPTSAVDAQSELWIRQSLSALEATTTIIVTHRLGAVADVDWLLIIEAGRVVDFGPRAEVVDRPAYAEIALLDEG